MTVIIISALTMGWLFAGTSEPLSKAFMTVLLFIMMGLHLLWPSKLPDLISWISIGITCAMMLYSFAMYTLRYIRTLREAKAAKKEESTDGE